MSQTTKENIRVHIEIIQLMYWFIRRPISLPSPPDIIEFYIRIYDFQTFNMFYGNCSKINEVWWLGMIWYLICWWPSWLLWKKGKGIRHPKEFFEMYIYSFDAYIWEVIIKKFLQLSKLRNLRWVLVLWKWGAWWGIWCLSLLCA